MWPVKFCAFYCFISCSFTEVYQRSLTCFLLESITGGIDLFKVNNGNIGMMCKICSKLTMKTPDRDHWCRSGVFIVNFEQFSHIALMFVLSTLNNLMPTGVYLTCEKF